MNLIVTVPEIVEIFKSIRSPRLRKIQTAKQRLDSREGM